MDAEVLERGRVFFLYRPKVETKDVAGLGDVQRFHVVLSPERGRHRRIVVGRKRLPDPRLRQRAWGYVEKVGDRAASLAEAFRGEVYETKTLGERWQGPSRAVGEGPYALVRHEDHVHLSWRLVWPEVPGAPQVALRVAAEGSLLVAALNPEEISRAGIGGRQWPAPAVSEAMRARFRGRKYAPADPELLDVAGIEIVLIGGRHAVDVALDSPAEEREPAIFRAFRVADDALRVRPLLEGRWE